jgi:hypothetical protein
MLLRVVMLKWTDVSEAHTAFIIRVMISGRYIPVDYTLHTRRRENLKYHTLHEELRAVLLESRT